jgi:predicted TIM-barrel fold metal-dependent hydrolase
MFGVIEQGASWVPGWMRMMDSAVNAFSKMEERLRNLSALPSQIVRRQVRVTPYPSEDVGWIVSQAGEEVCLFSSDYPHVEGGRNPVRRFEGTMQGLPASAVEKFYRRNFEGLMGAALAGI